MSTITLTIWPRPGGHANRRAIPRATAFMFGAWLAALLLAGSCAAIAADDGAPILRQPAAERVVAMADWHGDLAAARRALRLVGAIDEQDRWIGGQLVVVQTGDQTDRGDQERAILDLLERLRREAAAAGGAVHALLGNHEIMNAVWDFRYVTPEGWTEFADLAPADVAEADLAAVDPELAALPAEQRGRAVAFRPGGPYARLLADFPVALIVGRDLFVHGGILPEHVTYGLQRLNTETRAWLRGEGPRPPLLAERENPIWVRRYCRDVEAENCALLAEVLVALDCDRMFVGHTIQRDGITPNCGQRVWCLDTGAADYYLGPVEAVEITIDGVRILR